MIVANVNDDIRKIAYDWLAPRAYIMRDMEHTDRHIMFAEEKAPNVPLGVMLFSDYDGHNIFVHLAIDNPRVCQRRFIRLMFDYAFKQCKCHRMTALCKDGYERNERLLSGVGFVKEGIVRDALYDEKKNVWMNGALYGMLKGECRWV